MPSLFADVVLFTPTLGGTTDWTFSAAVTGYQSPALAGIVNGATYSYRAESTDLTQWEVGTGTYNTSTGVLTRTNVIYNSSGTGTGAGQSGAGTKISFSSVPTIGLISLAEDMEALFVQDTAPASPRAGTLWWQSSTGNLYIYYNDGNSSQWVSAIPAALPVAAVQYDVAQGLNSTQKDQAQQNLGMPGILRGYLQGLVLSTAGSSTTFGIAAGVANDSTFTDFMSLTSAYTKTTSAWAVGTAAGALDTGAIANSTWYHVYLIKRVDTGVVDVLISLSATAPTLPTNYTLFRRIGSMVTNPSSQWQKFSQQDDTFLWDADDAGNAPFVNGVPGVSTAVLRSVTTPLGIKTIAILRATMSGPAASNFLASSPDVSDQAATSVLNLAVVAGGTATTEIQVRTDTSRQIRTRVSSTTANIYLTTAGWIDARGKL